MAASRDSFLNLLSQWEYNYPLNSQWILIIHQFPQAIRTKIQSLEVKNTNSSDWSITPDAFNKLTGSNVNSTIDMGCSFVDSVQIPGEQMDVMDASTSNMGGFISGAVGGNRSLVAGNKLITSFRETNLDFTEGVIRPWIILGEHYGFFAYSDEEASKRVRVPRIQLISFGKSKNLGAGERPVRKIYNFYNCAPVGIDDKRYSYQADTTIDSLVRSVGWIYDRFSVSFS